MESSISNVMIQQNIQNYILSLTKNATISLAQNLTAI